MELNNVVSYLGSGAPGGEIRRAYVHSFDVYPGLAHSRVDSDRV